MKNKLLLLLFLLICAGASWAQFSFHLIDNFEDGDFSADPKWWRFGDVKAEVLKNPKSDTRDLIAESCGDYSLNMSGSTNNWYIGGIGTDIGVDGSRFSRFQMDVYGDEKNAGKIKIELFDDDNNNYTIEQDPRNGYEAVHDDKWVAEVNVLGKGFTRISIPFSAFKDANPNVGDGIWNPNQENGSGGLMKMQLVLITEKQVGELNCSVDNLLLTY